MPNPKLIKNRAAQLYGNPKRWSVPSEAHGLRGQHGVQQSPASPDSAMSTYSELSEFGTSLSTASLHAKIDALNIRLTETPQHAIPKPSDGYQSRPVRDSDMTGSLLASPQSATSRDTEMRELDTGAELDGTQSAGTNATPSLESGGIGSSPSSVRSANTLATTVPRFTPYSSSGNATFECPGNDFWQIGRAFAVSTDYLDTSDTEMIFAAEREDDMLHVQVAILVVAKVTLHGWHWCFQVRNIAPDRRTGHKNFIRWSHRRSTYSTAHADGLLVVDLEPGHGIPTVGEFIDIGRVHRIRVPCEVAEIGRISPASIPIFQGICISNVGALIVKRAFVKRKPREASSFFKELAVFALLDRTEAETTQGRASSDRSDKAFWNLVVDAEGTIDTRYIRKFIVSREGNGFCWALQIKTYDGHACSKVGLSRADVDAHAIVHSARQPPMLLENEPKLWKQPIRILLASGAHALDLASRVNFEKMKTIQHDVRAVRIGSVASASKRYFEAYCEEHYWSRTSEADQM